jgi:hypothetical protein
MSSSNSSVNVSGGVSTAGLLGVLFVGLKLTGYITWPWLWVLSPFWLPVAIVLGVLFAALAIVGLVFAVKALSELVGSLLNRK